MYDRKSAEAMVARSERGMNKARGEGRTQHERISIALSFSL